MAIVGYSPWNDAANFGSGLGQSLGAIILKLPMMKREVALEERRLDIQERQINAQEALNAAHMGLYRAQAEAIPGEEKRKDSELALKSLTGLGGLAINAMNAWSNRGLRKKQGALAEQRAAESRAKVDAIPVAQQLARDKFNTDTNIRLGELANRVKGTESLIDYRGKQGTLAEQRTAESVARTEGLPQEREDKHTLAQITALSRLLGIEKDTQNAITARGTAQASVANANFGVPVARQIPMLPPLDAGTLKGGELSNMYSQVTQRLLAPKEGQQIPSYQPGPGRSLRSTDPAPSTHPYKGRSRSTGQVGWLTPEEADSGEYEILEVNQQ